MWTEDRRRRSPAPFRPPDPGALDGFGPLPAPAGRPPREGTWNAPSPRPQPGDETLSLFAFAAPGRPRGVAILVPPWKVPGLGVLGGWRRLLLRSRFDVWTLVPPRHLGRTPAGERSGEAFVSPDLRAVAAALAQTVAEVRLLAALARERGGETAVVGLSLGALAAAFAATAAEPLDAAVLVAPPGDLGLLLERTRVGRRYATLAARAGGPLPAPQTLAPALAPFRPGERRPTARRILVAAGSEDRIVPAEGTLRLASAWGVSPRVYPRGHLTLLFACRALRRDVGRFLAGG